jgi:predicted CXXCH cytochrome family protein
MLFYGRLIFLLNLPVMRGSKYRNNSKFRIKPESIGLMLLAIFVVFFISCDEVQRHETLTFFFDGVPPLQPEMFQDEFVDSNSLEPDRAGQKPAWYIHEPRKDCSICHGKRKQRGFSSQTYLTKSVPKLCHDCHTDYTESATFVHGPVAVGQCIFCHNPHKSKIEHLLVVPEPGLCYLCHDINTIELITDHLSKQLSTCTDCHNPHASSIKGLLNRTIDEIGQANAVKAAPQDNTQVAKEPYIQSDYKPEATTSAPAQKSKSISDVFRETSRLIEMGQLQQARTYLEKFKESNSFTAEQQKQFVRVLKMIDSVITNNEQQLEINKQTKNKINEITELYYSSMAFYRTGQLIQARKGFVEILNSDLIPEQMAKTIRGYISDIDNSLAGNKKSEK